MSNGMPREASNQFYDEDCTTAQRYSFLLYTFAQHVGGRSTFFSKLQWVGPFEPCRSRFSSLTGELSHRWLVSQENARGLLARLAHSAPCTLECSAAEEEELGRTIATNLGGPPFKTCPGAEAEKTPRTATPHPSPRLSDGIDPFFRDICAYVPGG